MAECPGEQFAKDHGYTIYSHSGSLKRADYIKDDITLTVYDNNVAKLTKILGSIFCDTGEFSIPNKNFHMFENQLKNIVQIKE